jgi:hypothetical protein
VHAWYRYEATFSFVGIADHISKSDADKVISHHATNSPSKTSVKYNPNVISHLYKHYGHNMSAYFDICRIQSAQNPAHRAVSTTDQNTTAVVRQELTKFQS